MTQLDSFQKINQSALKCHEAAGEQKQPRMVHIINGEIVADDDPRVKARFQGASAGSTQRRSAGGVAGIAGLGSSGGPPQGAPAAAPAGGAGASPLDGISRRLGLEGTVLIPGVLGIPARPIEKIHLAIAVLLVFLFGWRALVFLAFAYFLSAQQPTAAAPVAGGAPPRHGGVGGPAPGGVRRL